MLGQTVRLLEVLFQFTYIFSVKWESGSPAQSKLREEKCRRSRRRRR